MMRTPQTTRCVTLTALVFGACAAWAVAPPAVGATLTGQVVRIADGDTLTITSRGFDTRVRLVGIDTPEVYGPRVECGARQASARIKQLVRVGATVSVVSDPTQATRDRYDRFLGYVYLPGQSGQAGSVNYRLVREGLAYTYIYRGVAFQYAPAFLAAERQARAARRGVWGAPCRGRR